MLSKALAKVCDQGHVQGYEDSFTPQQTSSLSSNPIPIRAAEFLAFTTNNSNVKEKKRITRLLHRVIISIMRCSSLQPQRNHKKLRTQP